MVRAVEAPASSNLAGRIGLERTLALIARLRELGILLALGVIVLVVAIQAPVFFTVAKIVWYCCISYVCRNRLHRLRLPK